MTALYAFGCSNTFGEGLRDCYEAQPHDSTVFGSGQTPSQLAWPAHAARALGLECVNLALPGISNKFICQRIINTTMTRGSSAFVHWTFPHRYTIFQHQNLEQLFSAKEKKHIINMEHTLNIGAWKLEQPYRDRETVASRAWFKSIYNAYDLEHDLHQAIYTADLHFKSIGIRAAHTVCKNDRTPLRLEFPQYLNNTRILRVDIDTLDSQQPKALDGRHPGELSHELFGKLVARALSVNTK